MVICTGYFEQYICGKGSGQSKHVLRPNISFFSQQQKGEKGN